MRNYRLLPAGNDEEDAVSGGPKPMEVEGGPRRKKSEGTGAGKAAVAVSNGAH